MMRLTSKPESKPNTVPS